MPEVVDSNADLVVDAQSRIVTSADMLNQLRGLAKQSMSPIRQTATAVKKTRKKQPRLLDWLASFWR